MSSVSGGFAPDPTWALPLDPAGELSSFRPPHCPPLGKILRAPMIQGTDVHRVRNKQQYCLWNIEQHCQSVSHCPLMDRSCSCPCCDSVTPGENVTADWVRDCVNGKAFAGSVRPQCCWWRDSSFWSRCNCVTICCNWSFSSAFSCITLSWSWQHSRRQLASFHTCYLSAH